MNAQTMQQIDGELQDLCGQRARLEKGAERRPYVKFCFYLHYVISLSLFINGDARVCIACLIAFYIMTFSLYRDPLISIDGVVRCRESSDRSLMPMPFEFFCLFFLFFVSIIAANDLHGKLKSIHFGNFFHVEMTWPRHTNDHDTPFHKTFILMTCVALVQLWIRFFKKQIDWEKTIVQDNAPECLNLANAVNALLQLSYIGLVFLSDLPLYFYPLAVVFPFATLEFDFYVKVANFFVIAIPLMGLFAVNSVDVKICFLSVFVILWKLLLDLEKSKE